MNWLPNSEFVFQLLFDATWQSALLASIVLLLIRVLGSRIAPKWRVALWTIPLVRLVVLILPATPFSLFHLLDQAVVQSADLVVHESPASRYASSFPESPTLGPPVLESPKRETVETFLREADSGGLRALDVVIAVWAGGVLILIARWLLVSYALQRTLKRSGQVDDPALQALLVAIQRQPRLAGSVRCVVLEADIGPATCGIFWPKILISKQLVRELSRRDLQMVLAHELEHVRRHDCLILALGRLAMTLHWFNPLAYLVHRSIQREMELAVDISTVKKLGDDRVGEYGELLLRIFSRGRPWIGMAQMAGPGTNLRRRIEQLTRWKPPRRTHEMSSALIVAVLALAGLSGTKQNYSMAEDAGLDAGLNTGVVSDSVVSLHSDGRGGDGPTESEEDPQKEKTDGKVRHASGRVVDVSGRPLANARLFAEFYLDDRSVQRYSTAANELGEFSLDYVVSPRPHELYATWAYVDGHAVRVVNIGRAFAQESATGLEIRLPAADSQEFEVLLPDGMPCVGALVKPRYVEVPNGVFEADEPTGLLGYVPEELLPLLAKKTDRTGRVELDAIPRALLSSIEVEMPGYGRQHFSRLDRPLQLSTVGAVKGAIVGDSVTADWVASLAGTKLRIESQQGSVAVGLADVQLDKAGRFEVPEIARGNIRIDIAWDSDLRVHPFVSGAAKVISNEALELRIDVRPTVPVTGQVLTADTRKPVVGARISHRYPDERVIRIGNYVEADTQGRYTVYLAAGKVKRQVIAGLQFPYEYPRLEPIDIAQGVEGVELSEILVHPMQLVSGILVDEAGNAVSKAQVVLHTGSFRNYAGQAETNVDGAFEMRVRDWEYFSKASRSRFYWATVDRPAVNAAPPQLTRLKVRRAGPNAMVLERP